MNNLDIVLALFTTPNHRFSRVDATAAFQATTSATRGVTTGGVWGGSHPPPPIFRNGTLVGQKLRKGRAKLLKI